MRLLAPFAPLTGSDQSAALVRSAGLVLARIDQHFGGKLAELVFADPIRQMESSRPPRAAQLGARDQAAKPLINAQLEIEIADECEIETTTRDRAPAMVAQISPTFLEWGRAGAIVTFRREQRVADADAVIKGLGERPRINAPVQHIELATAGGRPPPRGQGVDRSPCLIFR